MTIDEIRRNAPEGATHYIDYEGITYHKTDGMFWYWITNQGDVLTCISWYRLLNTLN